MTRGKWSSWMLW